jgi:quercetin dioxygenase-like cupin family protein
MRIINYLDVEAIEDAPGVARRVVIGPEHGAKHFVMRVFHIQPGSSTPFHSHWWEHEIFVLSGQGIVRSKKGEIAISDGTAVFVQPNEEHCFTNNGNDNLKIICLIPTGTDT